MKHGLMHCFQSCTSRSILRPPLVTRSSHLIRCSSPYHPHLSTAPPFRNSVYDSPIQLVSALNLEPSLLLDDNSETYSRKKSNEQNPEQKIPGLKPPFHRQPTLTVRQFAYTLLLRLSLQQSCLSATGLEGNSEGKRREGYILSCQQKRLNLRP